MANTFNFGAKQWATKKGSVLAYNSENNNFKPLPFDFTRASNATRVNKQGLIETVGSGKPRIDFLDNTSGHLLLEPSRTNYITQSIDLADWASFVASGTVTRTNEYSTSPDGLNKATRLQMSGGSSTQWTYLNVSNLATYASFYVKSTGSSSQNFRWFWNNGSNGQDFTATTEWQRFEVAVSQSSTLPMGFTTHSDLSASDILVWGVQAENGSYATSYIPTQGSGVTRVAETCKQENLPSASIPNSYPFTVFCNFEVVEDVKGFGFSFLNIGSSSEYFSLGYREDGVNNKFRFTNRISSIYNAETPSTYGSGFYKVAVVFSQTNIKAYINGSEVIDNDHPTASSFSNINDLLLGQLRTVTDTGSRNNVKDFRLYNTALSDTELQQLTS